MEHPKIILSIKDFFHLFIHSLISSFELSSVLKMRFPRCRLIVYERPKPTSVLAHVVELGGELHLFSCCFLYVIFYFCYLLLLNFYFFLCCFQFFCLLAEQVFVLHYSPVLIELRGSVRYPEQIRRCEKLFLGHSSEDKHLIRTISNTHRETIPWTGNHTSSNRMHPLPSEVVKNIKIVQKLRLSSLKTRTQSSVNCTKLFIQSHHFMAHSGRRNLAFRLLHSPLLFESIKDVQCVLSLPLVVYSSKEQEGALVIHLHHFEACEFSRSNFTSGLNSLNNCANNFILLSEPRDILEVEAPHILQLQILRGHITSKDVGFRVEHNHAMLISGGRSIHEEEFLPDVSLHVEDVEVLQTLVDLLQTVNILASVQINQRV